MMSKSLSLFVLYSALLTVQTSLATETYATSAFIQSASPSIILDTRHHNKVQHLPTQKQQKRQHDRSAIKISNGNIIQGMHQSFGNSGTVLFARNKKDTTVGKGGKIQVKLLKHVAGTGSAGEVIMVAPAFFTNKLQKTKSAVRISNDEVAQELAEKSAAEKDAKDNASVVKDKLESMELSLAKKAGPDGHLFGGVGYKVILSELKKEFPQGCLDGKQVKISQIKNSEGKKLRGDIKETGNYSVTINLLKGVSADVELSVVTA